MICNRLNTEVRLAYRWLDNLQAPLRGHLNRAESGPENSADAAIRGDVRRATAFVECLMLWVRSQSGLVTDVYDASNKSSDAGLTGWYGSIPSRQRLFPCDARSRPIRAHVIAFGTSPQGCRNKGSMAQNVFWQDRHERTSSPNLFSCGRHKIVLDVVVPPYPHESAPTPGNWSLLRSRKGKGTRKRWHRDRPRVPERVCSSTVPSQADSRRALRQTVDLRDRR